MKLAASIILATYCPNEERYELCRQSFMEMGDAGLPRDWYEVIVVNNGGLHIDLIQGLNPDLVITNSRNVGQASGLNEGIAVSKSPNLVLIDDDLGYARKWLAAAVKMVNYYPEHVVSLRGDFDPKGKYVVEVTRRGDKIAKRAGGVWAMRRRVYDAVGPFADGYFDWGGLWTRNMRRKGVRFVISKTPYIFHRGEAHSIVGRSQSRWSRFLRSQ